MSEQQPSSTPAFWQPGSQGLWVGLVVVAVAIGMVSWAWPYHPPNAQAGTAAPVVPSNNPPVAAPPSVPGGAGTSSASRTTVPDAPSSSLAPAPLVTGVTAPTNVTLTYSSTGVAAVGSGTNRPYIVAMETGAGVDVNTVAKAVATTLNNPRSWSGSGKDKFTLVDDPSLATFSVVFVTHETAGSNTMCGGAPVCTLQRRTVIIDVASWNKPAATYANKQADFRAYLVNRGVGYVLGNITTTCPKAGYVASVMQPQDLDLAGCTANPWVYSASRSANRSSSR